MCMEQALLQWNVAQAPLAGPHGQAQCLNPKYVTTYTGENHGGLHVIPGIVPGKGCWRFRLGLWLRLTGRCVDQEGGDVE